MLRQHCLLKLQKFKIMNNLRPLYLPVMSKETWYFISKEGCWYRDWPKATLDIQHEADRVTSLTKSRNAFVRFWTQTLFNLAASCSPVHYYHKADTNPNSNQILWSQHRVNSRVKHFNLRLSYQVERIPTLKLWLLWSPGGVLMVKGKHLFWKDPPNPSLFFFFFFF